jgi:beta-xylosidase
MYQLELPLFWRSGNVPDDSAAILHPLHATCAPWERDPEGWALLETHTAWAAPAAIVTPDDDVPNPFVLVDDGRYFLYATHTGGLSPNVPVRVSDDRYTWSEPTDALPNLPDWVAEGFTWAPDVLRVGDSSYVMWFTAGLRDSGPAGAHPIMCIGVAVSASPTGPFEPVGDGPRICQRERRGSIDPRSFRSRDGRLWLHWKSDDNADVDGDTRSSIYGQELAADGVNLIGQPQRILEVDSPWEGRIVEAPHMVDADGDHWLFYSGNWFNQPGYALGIARCDGPLGPCTKPSDQPWLASNAQGMGPGEASLFVDSAGWWIVYSPTAVLDPNGTPRPVALAAVDFGPDGPYLAGNRR